MKGQTLIAKLTNAKGLDETKDILKDHPELDAERVWNEICGRRSDKSEKLDLGELEAVSGGVPRLDEGRLRGHVRVWQLVLVR